MNQMPLPKKQFEAWFRSQLYNVDMGTGRCRKFVLRHANSASRTGNIIITIEVPNVPEDETGMVNDGWIDETAKSIADMAQGDADGRGGMNNYIIQSYHGESAEPSARFAIRMHGDGDNEDDSISSEPATKTGLIAQTMRHLEAVMRSATIAQANVLSTMQRTAQQQENVIEKLLNEKFENINLVESLLSQKNEREIKQAQAIQATEMKEKVMSQLMLMAPVVLNKFMSGKNGGQKAIPEATTPAEMQIGALADSFTQEQVEKLVASNILAPEQLMTLVNIITNAKEKNAGLLQNGQQPVGESK